MKIRYLSDLHLEADLLSKHDWDIISQPDDIESVLVLAGDIGQVNQLDSLFSKWYSRFKYIVYVSGNHEFYGDEFNSTIRKIDQTVSKFDNIFHLNGDNILIDDVLFTGGTLWSQINPVDERSIVTSIADFKNIRHQGFPLIPRKICGEHYKQKGLIFKSLRSHTGKSVVVTHFLPSFESVAKRYYGSSLNSYYATELGNNILDHEPTVWIHGHTHDSMDYEIGKTRILCNPRGYHPNLLNKKFDVNKSITI